MKQTTVWHSADMDTQPLDTETTKIGRSPEVSTDERLKPAKGIITALRLAAVFWGVVLAGALVWWVS